MIQVGPDGAYTSTPQHRISTIYQPEQLPETSEEPGKAADSPHYLLAFKNHSIYSAVAYWADGDTLHYFTTGNIHNQASMSLLDRDLTERLNRELGIDFTLPPAK
jgi:endonuclease YncB( thermonuclease family)